MASERQQTKRLIRASQAEEPELDQALAHSLEKQLEIARENNRHKEALQSQEFGSFGRWLGGPNQASLSMAALVAMVSLMAALVCAVAMLVSPLRSGVLEKPLTLFIGLVATTLAYLFGARSTRTK